MKNNGLKDDLTAVKGIGSAFQEWLAVQFKVDSFAALAALSVDEVELAAKKAGKRLPKGEVAGWIAQGKTLAAEKEETAVAPKQPAWKPFASFVVEFQQNSEDETGQRRTKVHYMEEDKEVIWPGIERERLGLWLGQYVQVQEELPEAKQPAAPPKASAPPAKPTPLPPKARAARLTVRATNVHLGRPPDDVIVVHLDEGERPFLTHIYHQQLKTLALDFALEPDKAGQPLPQLAVQCQLHNLTTTRQSPVCLDMQRDLESAGLRYQTKLTPLAPGIYRIRLFLHGERPLRPPYLELPKLNVL